MSKTAKLICPYCNEHLQGWDVHGSRGDMEWDYPHERLRKGEWHRCISCGSEFMLQEGLEILIDIQT